MADKPVNSPKPQSLDEIVTQSAVVITEQIRKAANWAKSEMDLQVEVAGFLKDFARQAKINPLEGHQNVTIATGRPDSVYGSLIVEYKKPGTLSLNKEAAPNKVVIDQLKRRFYDMNREEHRQWNSMFGVGTDGRYFVFLRFLRDRWTDWEPAPVDRYSTERFLRALYNLGQKGWPYLPDYLHGDFGSESPIAQEGVGALYEEIVATENPKAQVFFNQWKILFGEVCGYDVENLSDKLKKLAEFYVVRGKPQPAPLLFAVHTYYAILIKLLAAEIVSFFNPLMPRQVERLQGAETPEKLQRELEDLESGGIFRQMGITNFLEGDLFAWYLAAWTEPIQLLVRRMISKLDEYNPGTFSEEPAQSRDLLKKLYQQLFPKSVRHDLGEYYTPDWLAEHVLNELGYEGDPDKRLLDPACGSGTFLLMAINRIRRWYDQNREKCAYDEGGLLKKILANVIGFDLNPLAVMAARTNYLVAIKDLIRHVDSVEIPVYLCDSIMTPGEYGDLFAGAGKVARVPCSAMKPPHLLVPKEIAQSPKEVAKYAEVLEKCVKNGYAPNEFLARCHDEGLNITATQAHLDLYKELVKLDKANKNGIWARIIKNNFAPLFVGRVHYVAGNPPWINWENLPQGYREQSAPLWDKYGLRRGGGKHSIGKSKHEMAGLFLYASADAFLKNEGRLGFVITQSLFKNQGASGFRMFKIADAYLAPLSVTDLIDCPVFESAVNRVATIIVRKQKQGFSYPIPLSAWEPTDESQFSEELPLDQIKRVVHSLPMEARPSDANWAGSPWLTCPKRISRAIDKVLGRSAYRAYEGVNSGGLVGAFRVRKVRDVDSKTTLIENLTDAGNENLPRVQARVETALLYPFMRGRDVSRWMATESCLYLLTHEASSRTCIGESDMRRKYPRAFEYLSQFRDLLLARKSAPVRQQMKVGAFYAVLGVGPYTVAEWKIVFKDLTEFFQYSVVGPSGSSMPGKVVVADYTLRLVPVSGEAEAHYVAAVLNSSPCVAALYYSSAGVQTQRYHAGDAEKVRVPAYERSGTQRVLSELSGSCHAAAAKGDLKEVAGLEAEIDKAAAKLWGITDDELTAIQDALAESSKCKRAAGQDNDD